MDEIADQPKVDRAIAIKHEPEVDPAPRITAAGVGREADKIIELALQHGIKLRQDASLAEVLSAFEVDSLVPVEALDTVAEILTHLYRIDGRLEERQDSLDAMKRPTGARDGR